VTVITEGLKPESVMDTSTVGELFALEGDAKALPDEAGRLRLAADSIVLADALRSQMPVKMLKPRETATDRETAHLFIQTPHLYLNTIS